jgi:hypothetical protein
LEPGQRTNLHMHLRQTGIAIALLTGCGRAHRAPGNAAPAAQAGQAVVDTGVATFFSDVRRSPIPPDVAAQCDSVAGVAVRRVNLTLARADGSFADSFRGTRRLGCRLYANGEPTIEDSLEVNTALFDVLEARGWSMDLRYTADGPDGGSIGIRRLAVLCLVSTHGAGHDDDDTTTVTSPPDQSVTLVIECARDVADNADAGVPDSLWDSARAAGLDSLYAIDLRLQYPPYTEGDFDGDGVRDAAILVQQRRTGKVGVAFVMGRAHRVVIVGAGHTVPGAADDFAWVNTWDVGLQSVSADLVRRLMANGPFVGDVLRMSRDTTRNMFLYWKGSGFVASSP